MNKEKCSLYNKCEAPICPMDELKDRCAWFPGEQICKSKDFQDTDLIEKQQTISKKTKDKDKYFTTEMIEKLNFVKNGIVGVDPDKGDSEYKDWIKKRGGEKASYEIL